jgi:peptide chain release factor subunit 1
VRNRVDVHPRPTIRPLELLLHDHERFAVVLVDRARTRLFRLHLGVISEHDRWADDVMGQHHQGGWSQARFSRHIDEEAHRHLRGTADAVLHMLEADPFDRLLLGGPEEVVTEFERMLHSYLHERLAGRLTVALADPVDSIRAAALAAEERWERHEEARLVEKLREAVGRGDGGVSGLASVREAVSQRRADVLLVAQDFAQPGWRCPECRALAAVGPKCRACEAAMERLDDVVEEAIEEAVAQSARVEMVTGNADLDVLGRIGALLRF